MRRDNIAGAAAFVIVGSGFVFSVAANWPGHLSYDSIIQLAEGRSGRYGNWHPPAMSWLLGVFDQALPGAGLFVVCDAALVFGALVLALALPRKSSWPAVAIALGSVLTPQFLLYTGIVWKDVLFAAAAVMGFLLLALAASRWNVTRLRLVFAGAALLLLSLAALTRQNGVVVLPFGCLALAWIAARKVKEDTWGNAALWGLGSFVAASVLCLAAYSALETRSVGQTGVEGQFRLLATYDLAGALHREPSLALEELRADPTLEHEMRVTAANLYTPERNDTLASSPSLQKALIAGGPQFIPPQWNALVRAHPLLYLKVRWDAFRWVLFTPDIEACRPVYSGVSGPDNVLRVLGMTTRLDQRDVLLRKYADAFAGTPVFRHLTWLAICLIGLFVLLCRRNDADIAVICLVSSALVFVATFFVISIACDYRYLYYVDLAGLVTLAYLASDLRGLTSAGSINGSPRRQKNSIAGPR